MTNSSNRKQGSSASTTSGALSCLGSTVGSFTNRLAKGLKEQEERNDQAQRLKEARHDSMLHAMTTIRKALQETCKIKLGERFGFDLDVSDWEGWPRVELMLIDYVAPDQDCLALVVTANDNNELGNIMIAMKSGEIFNKISLAQHGEIEKIPVILKRSVRSFLDIVGAYVLNPVPEELVEAAAKPIEADGFDEVAEKLRREEMFIEEQFSNSRENIVDESEASAPLLESLAFVAK